MPPTDGSPTVSKSEIWSRRARGLGWVVAGALLSLVALRFVWHDGAWPLVVANAFTPYVFALAHVVLGAALARRAFALAAAGAVPAIYHVVVVLVPMLPSPPPPAMGPSLRVVSANLYYANQYAGALARELAGLDADVLMLQEVSPLWARHLERHGLERYAERHVFARQGTVGMAILSRVPLDDVRWTDTVGLHAVEVTASWARREVDLLNVHVHPPGRPSVLGRHRRGLQRVERWLRARRGRTFILAGDLNNTPYSAFSRRVAPFAHDAWALGGGGLGHTAPNDRPYWYPPMQLDHVYLSSDLTVRHVWLGEGRGSDHKPVVASVAARRARR